jgi:hypothetical protein
MQFSAPRLLGGKLLTESGQTAVRNPCYKQEKETPGVATLLSPCGNTVTQFQSWCQYGQTKQLRVRLPAKRNPRFAALAKLTKISVAYAARVYFVSVAGPKAVDIVWPVA